MFTALTALMFTALAALVFTALATLMFTALTALVFTALAALMFTALAALVFTALAVLMFTMLTATIITAVLTTSTVPMLVTTLVVTAAFVIVLTMAPPLFMRSEISPELLLELVTGTIHALVHLALLFVPALFELPAAALQLLLELSPRVLPASFDLVPLSFDPLPAVTPLLIAVLAFVVVLLLHVPLDVRVEAPERRHLLTGTLLVQELHGVLQGVEDRPRVIVVILLSGERRCQDATEHGHGDETQQRALELGHDDLPQFHFRSRGVRIPPVRVRGRRNPDGFCGFHHPAAPMGLAFVAQAPIRQIGMLPQL